MEHDKAVWEGSRCNIYDWGGFCECGTFRLHHYYFDYNYFSGEITDEAATIETRCSEGLVNRLRPSIRLSVSARASLL